MLAMETRPIGGRLSVRSLRPVRDDGTHPFQRQSYEEDSYTPSTLVEEQSIGEAIGTFSLPVKITDYTPASPVADQEVKSNHSEIAAFEKHTKGFGMRMLSKLGYRKGQGLGKYGQGRAEPIEVHERPLREGLGYAGEYSEDEILVIRCIHC
jgi:hypothetical protein